MVVAMADSSITSSFHVIDTYVILTLFLFHQTQTRRRHKQEEYHAKLTHANDYAENITIKIFNENIKTNILQHATSIDFRLNMNMHNVNLFVDIHFHAAVMYK